MPKNKTHHYQTKILWIGNKGEGTSNYRAYSRNFDLLSKGKSIISASSDPNFLGDPQRYNPEEMLVASLSGCHMLWYLHLCAEAGVVVIDYIDEATGIMEESSQNGGQFKEVILNPKVIISADSNINKANQLHEKAHKMCFIANSVNFSVKHNPLCNFQEL